MKKVTLAISIVGLLIILVGCNSNSSSDTSQSKDNEKIKLMSKLTHLIMVIMQKVAINKIKNKTIIKTKKKIMIVMRINNLLIKIKAT